MIKAAGQARHFSPLSEEREANVCLRNAPTYMAIVLFLVEPAKRKDRRKISVDWPFQQVLFFAEESGWQTYICL